MERWGPEVAPGGSVDRDKVARSSSTIATSSLAGERRLTPGWARTCSSGAGARSGCAVAVVEVPLLFEAAMEDAFDATVAMVAEDELRDARLRERGQAGLEGREARQLDQDEKAARADHRDPQRRYPRGAGARGEPS